MSLILKSCEFEVHVTKFAEFHFTISCRICHNKDCVGCTPLNAGDLFLCTRLPSSAGIRLYRILSSDVNWKLKEHLFQMRKLLQPARCWIPFEQLPHKLRLLLDS
jgi:hypothetical protein